jgi:hypothetical protein
MLLGRARTAAFLVLLLNGCQASLNPSSVQPPVTSASPLATESPSATESVLAGVAATCGDDIVFAAAALNGPGNAQFELDAAAEALRAFLAEPHADEVNFPAVGWHRVFETPNRVLFVAPRQGGDPWAQVAFVRSGAAWTLDLFGACAPHIVLAGGLGIADWWLDPALPRPGPKDRAFTALVLERACASGHSSDGRIAPPLVAYAPDAVSLIFGVRPRPGAQDCPVNPPGRFRVTLDQPLGDRQLLDGGSLPPRDATVAPDPPLGAAAGQPADGLE